MTLPDPRIETTKAKAVVVRNYRPILALVVSVIMALGIVGISSVVVAGTLHSALAIVPIVGLVITAVATWAWAYDK